MSPNKASAVDSLGLPTGYTPSSTFGTATGNTVTNLNNANINAFPLSFAGGQAGGRTILRRGRIAFLERKEPRRSHGSTSSRMSAHPELARSDLRVLGGSFFRRPSPCTA